MSSDRKAPDDLHQGGIPARQPRIVRNAPDKPPLDSRTLRWLPLSLLAVIVVAVFVMFAISVSGS